MTRPFMPIMQKLVNCKLKSSNCRFVFPPPNTNSLERREFEGGKG